MTRRRLFGLRVRFLAAGSLLVLTTIAASVWTLFVLSRLALVMETTVRDTDETTAAAADVASALEREDDELLVVLGGATGGSDSLTQARIITDRARDRLVQALSPDAHRPLASELRSLVLNYRKAVDTIVADPGLEPLERYHREANPLLRAAVAAVGRTRDQRFEKARAATALARDEVKEARGIVLLISGLALVTAAVVALRLARHVILPLRQLASGAAAIRDGNFETRIEAVPGDEIGQVADAFNEMTGRLAEFHRVNLGEVIRAKHTLEATMRALPDAVLLIDAEGRVASMNPAAEQLFQGSGRTPPETVQELLALAPASPRLKEAMLGQQALDRVDLQEALRIDLKGDVRRMVPRVVQFTLGDVGGGIIVVLSDVTELARLDEMRTELIAVASHELRTPVTTLRMSLLMLRESTEELEPRLRDLVQTALIGVDQLGETVDELLDMTLIEAGRLKLSAECVDLGGVVREVVARSQARADELGVRLAVRSDGDVAAVTGDRARLRIVINNIVNNALKYTPRGGTIEISLSSESNIDAGSERRVIVDVTDTGPGIPSEFRARVFEKFFRVEHYRPGSEEAPRGSGIGLYLCKEIVELHGGSIRCEKAVTGRGARIVFEVPARRHLAHE
jgi:NtrC-family two-component system sensor histidine kinase KinB